MEPFNRNQEKMQQQISGSISQGQQVPPFNKHPLVMIPTPSSISSTSVLQPNRSQPSVTGTSSGISNPSPAMINLPASTSSADPNQMVTSFNPHPLVMTPTASSISTAVLQPNRSQTVVTCTSFGTSNPSPAMINLPALTSSADPNQMVTPFNPHPLVMMPTASSISTAVLQPNRSQTVVTGTSFGTSNPSPAMINLPASTSSADPNQMVTPFNPHPLVMMPTSNNISSTAVLQPYTSQTIVTGTSSGTLNSSPAMIDLPASTSGAHPNQMVPPLNPHPLVMMPTASSISTAVLQPNRSQTILTSTSSGTSNSSPAMIDLPASTSWAHPNQIVPPFNPHPPVMMPTPSSIPTADLQPNRSQTFFMAISSGTSNPSSAMINLPASTREAHPNQMVTPFNPHPLVMMPTLSSISTSDLQPNRSQTFVRGTNSGTSNPSPPMINLPASTSRVHPNQMVTPFNPDPLVMVPTPSCISTAVSQPNRSQTSVTGTSSGTSSPPPAMINLPASTSMANRNQMVSSPFGSRGLPSLTPITSQPYTHQNISSTHFNPYRDQRFISTRLGPQIVPDVNSTNLRSPTNPQDSFSKGKQKAVSLASIKRTHDYMASTSNNTTGNRALDSAVLPQTNALSAGLSAISTATFNAAPTFQSIFRTPSQHNTLADAVTKLQQMLEPTESIYQLTTVNKVSSIYEQQLQKYLFYWNKRPSDNNNVFWRQFVAEFFAPDGKRKLCLSACQDQLTTKYRRFSKDNSPCGHCRTHSRYGYDIPFEELPIYFQYKFKSLTNETLMLGAFQEHQVDNDNILLYFPRVIEQSLYDGYWIVREGPLAIIFTADKKILSWQFCMRHCETLAHRRALISQVSEILRNAGVSSASGGSDQQAIQKNSDKIIKMGCGLAKKLENNMALRAQDAGTYMINDASNFVNDSTDFNSCKHQRKDWSYDYAAQKASSHHLQNQVIGSGSNQQVHLQVLKTSNPPSNPPNQLNIRASEVEHVTSSSASHSTNTDNVLNDLNPDDFFNDFFDGIDLDNYNIDSSNIDDDLLKYM